MTPATARPESYGGPPSRCLRASARIEESTALVLRYFDMWNTGEGALADELLSATYVEHAHPDFLGPAAARALAPRIHALSPGRVVTAEVVLADAEFVVVRTALEPAGAEGHPSGPRRGMAMFRVADGRIAEQWSWTEPVKGGV